MKKDFLKKVYRRFSHFIETASTRELDYFILDARYTQSFNRRIKELVEDFRKEGKKDAEISVIFDTTGEVVLIDGDIIGRYVGECYALTIEKYYKEIPLNRIVREVVNGNSKSQEDFIRISYAVLYNILGSLYREIKCKKEVMDRWREEYSIREYEKQDIPLIIVSLMIVEDICRYLGMSNDQFLDCVNHVKKKKNISN